MTAFSAFSVEEFATAYKVGRTVLFAEIAAGRLRTYRLGRRRYISADAAQEWQRALEAAEAEAAAARQEAVQPHAAPVPGGNPPAPTQDARKGRESATAKAKKSSPPRKATASTAASTA